MKKLRTKKRRINSKKGISMVLAIALVAVLFLSTTTFLSIAMLQQNETGTTMNSRQAYVSSKSALDMAEDLLNQGKLTLPSTGSMYYVFYYINGDPNVHVQTFSSAEDALNWINSAGSNYTIIGNAYVKISKNNDGTYTITAVGKENKYNKSNDTTGDISANFTIVKHLKTEKETQDLIMQQKKISNPPTASGSGFFMLGDQTAYSLLRSTYGVSHGNENDHYRTLKQASKQGDNVFYIPQLEAGSAPVSSFFPLVFDKTIQIDSNINERCKYTAYNNGIYLLGSSPNNGINGSSDYPGATDIAFYTKSEAFGAEFCCKYLVVSGNLVSRPQYGYKSLNLKYAGDNYSRDKGIVIYFTKPVTCKNYATNVTVSYSQGYYFLPISDNDNGVDLFDPNTPKLLQAITDLSNDTHYKNLEGIDVYNLMLDTSGKLKNMHSAFENISDSTSKPVSFLYSNGQFQSSNSDVYTTTEKTSYYTGWDDYYIYCAPSKMPSTNTDSSGNAITGYYDIYSGTEFNYLWYNVNSMQLNKGVNMNIRSKSIVLSIGPDQGETTYYTPNTSFTYPRVYNQTNLENGVLSDSNLKTYKSVNKIVQNDSSASFCVKPYWNETAFTLTVINDFTVEMANGDSYTVKAGKYTDIPSNGLNFFSEDAQTYFDKHSSNQEDADTSGIDWVINGTINTSVADSKLNQDSTAIKFEAPNGGTLKNGTYSAKAIYCDFGNTTKGNNATLVGDVISLGADKIDGNGSNNGLWINSYGGYSDSNCQLIKTTTITDSNNSSETKKETTMLEGSLIYISRDTKLILDDGLEQNLEEGYYYFPNIKSSFNILSSTFWQKWTTNNPYYYAKEINKDNTISYKESTKLVVEKVSFEGKYF